MHHPGLARTDTLPMLWLQAFHVIFVVTWFAGLFYLPRLFIYHLDAHDEESRARFVVMERRLLAITHIGGTLALGFGLALLLWWSANAPGYLGQGWLHLKLALVALLIGYHLSLVVFARRFRAGLKPGSARFFRLWNEVPSVLLIAIVVLVVVKPF